MPNTNHSRRGRSTFLFPAWAGKLWLWAFGWTVTGTLPNHNKYVLIGAPHTSNWDFLFMLAFAAVLRLRVSWMGKDSLFKRPFGGIMRRLGGIPIDRSRSSGMVQGIAQRFAESDRLVLLITVSGTRKKGDYWKSGFYWIAHTAQVPIVCAYLDYEKKEGGLGPTINPTGDVAADMNRIREFYTGIQGKYPELTSRVRLKEEDQPASGK
ncbi:MAG: acyltransferase [Chloroflexi bacterium]|nr:MAG: acyltransferase [Chloroflexota bacterium]